MRLDQAMVERGLCESREQAKRLILAGEVFVDGHRVDKPSSKVGSEGEITVRERPPYVSRGGGKLAAALDGFGIDPSGLVCLDAGSSTGGFTDCLLQRGASRVYAFDVGTNQLAWKLRSDPRVVVRERFNLRYLRAADVGELVQLVVMDLSFISLTLVMGACLEVLAPSGDLVCLIKPQFELGRSEVGKGGVVRDEGLRLRAVGKIERFVVDGLGKSWQGVVPSPVCGADGNQEYLAWIKNDPVV